MAIRRRHSDESDVPTAKSAKKSAGGTHSRSGSSSTPKQSKTSSAPLRRGDACLMCRAKKLKCSATKPVCDQCTKRKDRCVYDAVRPASRVEKLEKKLAEMEEAELRAAAAAAARRHSTNDIPLGGHGHSNSLSSLGHNDWSHNSGLSQFGGYDYSRMLGNMPSRQGGSVRAIGTPGTASTHSNDASPCAGSSQAGTSGVMGMEGLSGLSGLNGWQWPQQQSQSQQQQRHGDQSNINMGGAPPLFDQSAPTLEGMPWSLLSASNDVSTVWSMDMTSSRSGTGNGIDGFSQQDLKPQIDGSGTAFGGLDPYAHSLGLGFNLDPLMGLNLTQSLKHVTNHQPISFPTPPNTATMAAATDTTSTSTSTSTSVAPLQALRQSIFAGSASADRLGALAQPSLAAANGNSAINNNAAPTGGVNSSLADASALALAQQSIEAASRPSSRPPSSSSPQSQPQSQSRSQSLSLPQHPPQASASAPIPGQSSNSNVNASASPGVTGQTSAQGGGRSENGIREPGTEPPLPAPIAKIISGEPDAGTAGKTLGDALKNAARWESESVLTESDISQSARDYLLDLFFCPPRVAFGSELWSEEQFRAKMELPPEQRPHPCLVFSMYTLAASSSYIPAVRTLADSLYAIALVKLGESVAAKDRLVDAINAAKGLGKWQFSRARPLEGFYLSNQAMMLAQACNLHRIKTGIFREEDQVGPEAEADWPLLGPPKNQWDLAERIHAFWSCWASDRGAAIMTQFPNFLDDATIITPLPRPPEDYINGIVTQRPEFHIRDTYLLSTRDNLTPPDYMYGVLACALHLLYRAKSLHEKTPEAISSYTELALADLEAAESEMESESDSVAGAGGARGKPAYCARRDHPAAYKEIMEASYAIERKMKEEFKLKEGKIPMFESPDEPLMHACLIASRMLLHSLDSDSFDRDSCIQHARDFASLVELWVKELQINDEKPGMGMGMGTANGTNGTATAIGTPNGVNGSAGGSAGAARGAKSGLGGPYILTGWFWAADRLIKGARILSSIGRHEDAAAVSKDANLVVSALKSIGVKYQQSQEGSGN